MPQSLQNMGRAAIRHMVVSALGHNPAEKNKQCREITHQTMRPSRRSGKSLGKLSTGCVSILQL